MVAVERKLKEMSIDYVQRRVEEGGIFVDQLFFHDPDGFMVEICNCDKLPLVPLYADSPRVCARVGVPFKKNQQSQQQPQIVQCHPTTTTTIDVKEDCSLCMWCCYVGSCLGNQTCPNYPGLIWLCLSKQDLICQSPPGFRESNNAKLINPSTGPTCEMQNIKS